MVAKHRSCENLIGFYEISPDPVKISVDLREIAPESGNLSVGLGFKGGKLKPDPPESVSGDEDPPE